jgi:FkbM family methyltransferase
MKSMYTLIRTIISNGMAAKRSKYSLKQKFQIFGILNSLYFKSILFKGKTEVTQKIFSFKVTAYEYSHIALLFREIFLSKEYYFKCDKPQPAIIDCGANIGMSVLYFKFLYPDCSITAFEPNPIAYTLLKKNIADNNLRNVEAVNIGLSEKEGSIEFFTDGKDGILVASILKERGGNNLLNVKSMKLSDFIKNETFDLIKMDIEGAEYEVAKEMCSSQKLANSNKYIIEYHHRVSNNSTSLPAFIENFESAGFGYNLSAHFKRIGGFQDILFYFYKEQPVGQNN